MPARAADSAAFASSKRPARQAQRHRKARGGFVPIGIAVRVGAPAFGSARVVAALRSQSGVTTGRVAVLDESGAG